ncbi:hypothetical protein O6P43_026405 [Quillaja saponaria]|uniref:Uncharacterized protein n=1 Tax=Quillaja saponaria TaxID=32244 RepID=A0AAD7L2H6_QUISA|nr:hypothetical protein O6P43_026405 [Quillaja saponaria]
MQSKSLDVVRLRVEAIISVNVESRSSPTKARSGKSSLLKWLRFKELLLQLISMIHKQIHFLGPELLLDMNILWFWVSIKDIP